MSDKNSQISPFEEIPRYKKKAKKTPPKKLDHKHVFEECVFESATCRLDRAHGFQYDKPQWSIGTYCPICGKIGTTRKKEGWMKKTANDFGLFSASHDDWNDKALREFNPKTRTLPFFALKEPFGFDKFVDLAKKG